MAEKTVEIGTRGRRNLLSEVEKGSPLGYYFSFLIIIFVLGIYSFITFSGLLPINDILITAVCDALLILGTIMFFIASLICFTKSKNLRIQSGIIPLVISSFAYLLAGSCWAWYNIALRINIPFPSVADVFYVAGSLALIAGIYYMTDILNPKPGLNLEFNVLIVFLAVIGIAAILFIYAAFTNLFSDGVSLLSLASLAYPILDVVILAMVGNLILMSYGKGVFESHVVLGIGAIIMSVSHIYFTFITENKLPGYGNLFITLTAIAFMIYAMGVSRYVDLTKFDILVGRLTKLNKRV